MSTELSQDIISSMEQTLNYASKKVDQAEVMLGRSESFSLSADQGNIDKYQISNSRSVGVRVIKGNQVGISYTENINQESMEEMVNLAIENASLMKEDAHQKIIKPIGEKKLINTHEKNYADDNTETQKKIDLSLSLESTVKSLDTRIKSAPYNGYSEATGESYLINTEGLLSYERSKRFSCYTSCLMEEGTKNGSFYKGMSARSFDELNVDKVSQESYHVAKGFFEATALPTNKYDVIFTTDGTQDFLGCFSVIYSGKSTAEGKNPFKDKMNYEVFSNLITITDCPQFDLASYYHMFDDEGLQMSDLPLIENGVLKNFYQNSATANELKVENNSRASRSTKGQLGVGGTTKVIKVGSTTEKDLKNSPYLEVVSMQGMLHSGANAISGDFSFAASGFFHKDGEVIPFKGVTLSGNFYHIMKNQISAVGDALHSDSYSSFFSPKIRFEQLSISGE